MLASPPDKKFKLAHPSPTQTDMQTLVTQALQHPVEIPSMHNTLASLKKKVPEETLVNYANHAKPIIDIKFLKLAMDFLAYKQRHGSAKEKKLYNEMALDDFITRLLAKRPIVFFCPQDYYLLRDGKASGSGKFETIGTESEQTPLTLDWYLSYDEMQLAALITVATPSFFVNDGNRENHGQLAEDQSHEEKGLIVATVGARFERPEVNEYAHMLITREQNTSEKGYGKSASDDQKLRHRHFAQFYHQGEIDDYYFPSFEEAQADKDGKYILLQNGTYLNKAVYKQRIRAVIEPFLVAADAYGKEYDQSVFVEVSKIGLGAWGVDPEQQAPLQLEVYAEILSEIYLPQISDINFGRFKNNSEATWQRLLTEYDINAPKHQVQIQHIKREPLAKLPKGHENKCLVTNYPWDGNSFPGNEYWLGIRYFAASSDPAAACCTQIPELQNPLINPNICGQNAHVSCRGKQVPIQWFDGLKCHGQYPLLVSETEQLLSTAHNELKKRK